MKLVADLHTHTCVSTHAFSTMEEMAGQAHKLGLRALAVTDHAPGMPDSPHPWYFSGLLRLPDIVQGGELLLLKGVEANVLDTGGALDMEQKMLQKLDWVIVSIHGNLVDPLSCEEATQLWLNVAENPYVDMIGHSEQRQYLYDYDRVTKAFADKGKVVELNANSIVSRKGNQDNLRELALACKKNGTLVAVNSDAHSIYNLGNEAHVLKMLREIDFPQELVVNASLQRLQAVLQSHGRGIAQRAAEFFEQYAHTQ